MTAGFIAMLLLGAALGGFINGLAGFGTALFALGVWLRILPPEQAVPLVLILALVSGVQGVWLIRKAIEPRLLGQFLIPALIAAPLGVWSLSYLSATALKVGLGCFLLFYGAYFSLRTKLPKLAGVRPGVNAGVGLVAGWLGGAAGLSGAIPSMWCAMHDWPKERVRGVIQTFNFTVLGFSLIIFALRGELTLQLGLYAALCVPVTLAFAQIGIWTFKRLSNEQFRRLLIGLMFLSGLALLVREVL